MVDETTCLLFSNWALCSQDKRNFLRDPPAGVQFYFDMEQMYPLAAVMLEEDQLLNRMRFDLVPKQWVVFVGCKGFVCLFLQMNEMGTNHLLQMCGNVLDSVKEEVFWRNYFYRVSLIKQSAQLTALAAQQQDSEDRVDNVSPEDVVLTGQTEATLKSITVLLMHNVFMGVLVMTEGWTNKMV